MLEEAFKHLNVTNERKYFAEGTDVLEFLQSGEEKIFGIISSIKLIGMDGLQLRAEIQKDAKLKQRAIPFIFLTSDDRESTVRKAYELTVQGYFTKPSTLFELSADLELILQYWNRCRHTNT